MTMDYKDFIKAGNKVLHVPYVESWWQDYKPEVVTIGEYRPYYMDGTPDPDPEHYEGVCHVEVEDTKTDDYQIALARLFPIEVKEDKVLWEGKVYDVYGYATGSGLWDYKEDTGYCILKDGDELRVVEGDEVCSPRSFADLSHEEVMRLWGDIRRGSIYISDYRNSCDVPDEWAMQTYEEYWEYIVDEYGGEDAANEHDTAERFAEYCELCCVLEDV